MDADLTRWRAETPAAQGGRVHLNNAGASLMPNAVMTAITEHLERERACGGYEAADEAEEDIARAYASLASLIGAQPHNVAVVTSATHAYAQALESFDLQTGDSVVVSRNDYISNQLMFLSLAKRRGIRFVRAEDHAEGGVDPQSVREVIRENRPALVSLSWIPTNSGLVQAAAEVGAVCAEAGVPFLLDACQAVGQMPIDVKALQCDFLSATGRKFLRGPRGTGFLYVSDRMLEQRRHPTLIDMRGARWTGADEFELFDGARRFEQWEFAYALLLGLGAAAEYALHVGAETARERSWALAAYVREQLGALDGFRVLERGPELCAIATVETRGRHASELVSELREWGINTSWTGREFAVLDMDDKHASTALRISPHYYNTREEIDMLVRALRNA